MYSKQGSSLIRAVIAFLCVIGFLLPQHVNANNGAVTNGKDSSLLCTAPESYIAENEALLGRKGRAGHDSSCLVTYPDIASGLTSYQLIDSRDANSINPTPADAWRLSISQLKTKSFLKSRSLLIVGDGFSRARLSEDCLVLKSAGFEHVKMLVGGMDIWLQAQKKNTRTIINTTSVNSVTAHQVIYEYFNGNVVLVAASKEIAAELDAHNFKHYSLLDDSNDVTTIATTNSNNGMFPVVIIGREGARESDIKQSLPNVYELDGGISALVSQLKKNQVVNNNRSATPRRSFCGKT